jgi:uncharacterized protein (DUF2062 family)
MVHSGVFLAFNRGRGELRPVLSGGFPVSGLWRSTRNFVYRRILHADDTPHRIALGAAIGMFVAFTPTMGMQTVITLAIAALFRANKVVGLPFIWITNPVSFVPIYWSCWRLGALIRGTGAIDQEAAVIDKLHAMTDGGNGFISSFFDTNFLAGLLHLMYELGLELWIGCLVVGLVSAAILYLVTKWGVTAYRAKRHDRFLLRQERRRLRAAGKVAKDVAQSTVSKIKRKRVVPAGKTL